MHNQLFDEIKRCENGHVYATVNQDDQVTLVCLGTYAEVRHRFNQMVCLLGASIILKLSVTGATVHSRSAPAGSWFSRLDTQPLGDLNKLYALAAQGPSDVADLVGYQAFYGDWPVGTGQLSGYKAMVKSLSEISNVFYWNNSKPSAQIGCSPEVSTVRRMEEAIALAKRRGVTVYEEAALLAFMDTLEKGRFLHFFQQVHAA